MISAVFRRGGDVSFVADELKQVFDPRGGRWHGRRYVPSLVAAIGEILERHMRDTGFLTDPAGARKELETAIPGPPPVAGPLCPKCAQPGLLREGGCLWITYRSW
jgi:ribonucleoside-diphosphate reductase alpha chain